MNKPKSLRLRDVDLNLLVTFRQLLRDRRVSAAAQSLGLSQPAVSSALNRLRRLVGDELFVRTSRGMEPTPYAEQLAKPIDEALRAIQDALNEGASFEPLSSERQFVLAVADVGEIYFLPALMGAVAEAAPGVRLKAVSNSDAGMKGDMEEGKVDLAIGFLPDLKTDIFQRRLFRQRDVCLFRQGHPIDGRELTIEDFAQADHVFVDLGRGHGMVNGAIERLVGHRAVKLRAPHFTALPYLLLETDLVVTIPEKIARLLASHFPLSVAAHPMQFPDYQINLFWHAKFHHEPGNQWLRTLIYNMFSE